MPIFVNRQASVFFIHIPKCGGSSIEKCLEEKTGNIFLFKSKPGFFPCTPQHFDRNLISSIIEDNKKYIFFSIVRHPVLRLVSEYFHAMRRRKKKIDFNLWVAEVFMRYKNNEYINDNHIKPQCEFIMPNTTVFKFEKGLEAPLNFALSSLGENYSEVIKHEKKWEKYEISVDKNTLFDIQTFYSEDMSLFNYEPIVPKSDSLSLKKISDFVMNLEGGRFDCSPFFFDESIVRL